MSLGRSERAGDATTIIVAAIAGVVFAIGVVIADMTSPARVLAFLDIGHWDPTLGFVMAGAIAIYAPIARIVRQRSTPLLGARFHWPKPTTIDARLAGGAAIFGVGWGLSGYCPGPALVAAGTGAADVLVFCAAMIAGIAFARLALRDR